MNIGDKVRHVHIWDGSSYAGKPTGPVLTITEIKDHKPCDGPHKKDEIAILSDGSWSFVWNIVKA